MAGKMEALTGWWGQRWRQYALDEVLGWVPAESRLRGARRAQTVVSLSRGRVTAQVGSGAHGRTFVATFKVKPITERDWRRALDAIAADAAAAHRLLVGQLGPELEAALDGAAVRLFPEPSVARPIACTCREEGCRHFLALVVHTADLLDANPFLWFEVLGRSRAELLSAIRARLADRGDGTPGQPEVALTEPGQPNQAIDPERFWSTDMDPDAIAVRPGSAVAPDAVLRLLGPLPLKEEAKQVGVSVEREIARGGISFRTWVQEPHTVDDLLRAYAIAIGRGATDLAVGERSPSYAEAALPGKPVRLRERLVDELVEAVSKQGTAMTLDQLRSACPTAAVLPEEAGGQALVGVMDELPEEIAVLASRYVGMRSAILTGAAFRHVITFDEWRSGRLHPDADWVRALTAAGFMPPYRLRTDSQSFTVLDLDDPGGLFGALQPEVGDELRLTVADPVEPLLIATLRRRQNRVPTELFAENRAAVEAIFKHMLAVKAHRLPEWEAVSVLLGEGLYGEGAAPDPVWLLPVQAEALGLGWEGRERAVTVERWRFWRPHFRGSVYGVWRGAENEIRWFTLGLMNQGLDRKLVETATVCVNAWCRYYPGDQSIRSGQPPLETVLEFLWNVAPQEGGRSRLMMERVPEALARWFAFLGERYPEVGPAYREHVAACGLTEAYVHRVRTFPGKRPAEAELVAWRMEAYRWMGPGRYFSTAQGR